jgi:hypothetical protein
MRALPGSCSGVANKYRSHISDHEAFVTLALVRPGPDGKPRREFEQLKLEMDRVYFLVSSWTIVHPIDETSPLWGMTAEEFAEFRGEVLIQFRAVDETFLQNVFVRNSYRFEEVRWNHKFQTVMHTNAEGKNGGRPQQIEFCTSRRAAHYPSRGNGNCANCLNQLSNNLAYCTTIRSVT